MRRARRIIGSAAVCLLGIVLAGGARAGELYLSALTGISTGIGTSGGENTVPALGFSNSGEDTDSSPMLGGAIGFQFLLGDAMSRRIRLPKVVPWDLTLPNFNVRFEIEAVGARNYDLSTDGFTASVPYHAELSELSLMVNTWLDLPVRPAVTAAFGRHPSFDPMSVYFGAGVGYSRAELSVTDNFVAGEGVSDNFAWQIGVGVGYDLTERFTISAGYRYLDSGITEAQLLDPVGNDSGSYSLDLQSHEAVVSLRVSFYSVGWPRRSTRGLDW